MNWGQQYKFCTYIMLDSYYEESKNVLVRFHIGCGGRFFNAGHKTYVGTVSSLADCFGDSNIISEDEDGNALPDSEWQLVDSGGNTILTGRDEIESDTGILDWDGEYDTDIVRHISECDDDEYQLILDAAGCDEIMDEVVLAYACSALDKLLATSIMVYPSNMEVFTQEGCITLDRDSFGIFTEDEEDEVREELEDKGFISESIDEIISEMEIYQWFSEE